MHVSSVPRFINNRLILGEPTQILEGSRDWYVRFIDWDGLEKLRRVKATDAEEASDKVMYFKGVF